MESLLCWASVQGGCKSFKIDIVNRDIRVHSCSWHIWTTSACGFYHAWVKGRAFFATTAQLVFSTVPEILINHYQALHRSTVVIMRVSRRSTPCWQKPMKDQWQIISGLDSDTLSSRIWSRSNCIFRCHLRRGQWKDDSLIFTITPFSHTLFLYFTDYRVGQKTRPLYILPNI